MQERDSRKLEKLKQNLAKDQRQQDRRNTQIESVRTQLEKIARESVAKYHQEVETIRPETELAIIQIIQPWFSNLTASGAYNRLLGWCKSHGNEIRLSDTISYYWPKNALEVVDKVANKPYADTAEFIVEQHKEESQIYAGADEIWHAGFCLHNYEWERSRGIKIWRQPAVGMGFGFAMVSKSYEIPISVQNIVTSMDQINPKVWIKFSQQIASGQIWEIIDQSMRSKK